MTKDYIDHKSIKLSSNINTDNLLSNRPINLDPKGYFIIKVLEDKKTLL
ncbi:hypothetical protein CPAV1605_1149 [seawater metagenome]|uniref:Uncharacterized protein n=1 Tax=seawater metagenome TaxID=1561972 RepID=A0A5E8CJ88_9ZZZZ